MSKQNSVASTIGAVNSSATPPMPPQPLAHAWHGVDHYENFPVGSWLVPARLRPAVLAIYRFARYADDVADEGDAAVTLREAHLNELHAALTAAERGGASGQPVVDGLSGYVVAHGLEWRHFHDLLDAFLQDLHIESYDEPAAVEDYCRRSANPVGRLMLELFGAASRPNLLASDAICTALQRTNFLQDIVVDFHKNRVYLPRSTLAACGVDAARLAVDIGRGQFSLQTRRAVAIETRRTRAQLLSGAELIGRVPRRLGWELRFIVAGALQILDRLEASGHDVARHRPRLGWRDAPMLLGKGIALPWIRRSALR